MPLPRTRNAAAGSAAGSPVSNFISRLVVGGALLPVTLGLVWLGGWWLFGLAGCHRRCTLTGRSAGNCDTCSRLSLQSSHLGTQLSDRLAELLFSLTVGQIRMLLLLLQRLQVLS